LQSEIMRTGEKIAYVITLVETKVMIQGLLL
jgi:hypothetical protein